jgi:hypothetical protein
MLEYRVFEYGKDDGYIRDIVDAISHIDKCNIKQSTEWFSCRFEKNPIGKAIIIYATDKDRLVAFVVIERFPVVNTGLSFDGGFIHYVYALHDYKEQGVVQEMLSMAESEAKGKGLKVVVTHNTPEIFPYVKIMGWTYTTAKVRYRMHSVDGWRSLFKLLDCTRPFVPEAEVKQSVDQFKDYETRGNDVTTEEMSMSNLNLEMAYYKWVASVRPNSGLGIIEDGDSFCAFVIGHRGKRANVAHIVYMSSSNAIRMSKDSNSEIINRICKGFNVNVISCTDINHFFQSENSFYRSQSISFYCKWLDSSVEMDMGQAVSENVLVFG